MHLVCTLLKGGIPTQAHPFNPKFGNMSLDDCAFPRENKHKESDLFENPYGTPRPTEFQKPPSNKKEIPKTLNLREYLKVIMIAPKVNMISPKVNVLSAFREFWKKVKFLKFSVGGSRSQGFQKYLNKEALRCSSKAVQPDDLVVELLSVLSRILSNGIFNRTRQKHSGAAFV